MKLNKLDELINRIKISQDESKKAHSYADGYLDCLKDIMIESQGEVSKIFNIKNDGNIRMQVYSEILPILEEITKEVESLDSNDTKINNDSTNGEFVHPSERARNFLQRIGKI